MSGRLVLRALLVLGALFSGCYDVPKPDCGFVCGPDSACPDEYTCADDHRCHRDGTPSTLVCAPPDAAVVDGPPEPPDAAAPIDAGVR